VEPVLAVELVSVEAAEAAELLVLQQRVPSYF
jgi:hypothetical protein